VNVERVDATGLARYLPARWAYFRDRACRVDVRKLTAGQAERLDLRPLTHVQHLWLYKSDVDDSFLAQLAGAKELEGLHLGDNRLNGSGLAHLPPCRRLVKISLSGKRVTDAGLAAVGRQSSLQWLVLEKTDQRDRRGNGAPERPDVPGRT